MISDQDSVPGSGATFTGTGSLLAFAAFIIRASDIDIDVHDSNDSQLALILTFGMLSESSAKAQTVAKRRSERVCQSAIFSLPTVVIACGRSHMYAQRVTPETPKT